MTFGMGCPLVLVTFRHESIVIRRLFGPVGKSNIARAPILVGRRVAATAATDRARCCRV